MHAKGREASYHELPPCRSRVHSVFYRAVSSVGRAGCKVGGSAGVKQDDEKLRNRRLADGASDTVVHGSCVLRC